MDQLHGTRDDGRVDVGPDELLVAGRRKGFLGQRMELLACEGHARGGPEQVDALAVEGACVQRVGALDLELLEHGAPRPERDVDTVAADDAPLVERILAGMLQGDKPRVTLERRHLEAGHELDRVLGDLQAFIQRRTEGHQLRLAGCPGPATHPHAHRVDRSPAQRLDDLVADLLGPQGGFHDRPMVGHHGDAALIAQEVGQVEQVDVERVALDPLAAVEQPAERARHRIDAHPEQVLERVDRAHLVGHRTDAADARHHVDDLVGRAANDERLEVARGLEDPQARLHNLAVPDPQAQGAFALDARQLTYLVDALVHGLLARRGHGLPPVAVGSAAAVVVPGLASEGPLRAPPSSVTMLRNGSE